METVPPQDIVDKFPKPQPDVPFEPCTTCGLRSWYFVQIKGTELGFCGHHATESEVKLLSLAEKPPRDLRYLITP